MDKLLDYAPLLGRGAVITISVALLSLVLATLLGVLGASAKVGGGALSRGAAHTYTTIVRGIPDLVFILLIYFGGQRLINDLELGTLVAYAQRNWLGYDEVTPYLEISKFWAGVVAIGFIYGAYLTETFRGAYLAVPRGQLEAAQSLGLRRLAILRKVLMPQVLRFALPGYGNVWMVLVKSTAVISVIGLEDLVGLADKAGKSTREPFLFLVAVILVYLAITSASGAALRRAEDWAGKGHPA